MEQGDALTTLLHAARRQLPLSSEELKSAHNLLMELGCLVVAVVQAGTYCHELSYSFTQYLKLFYSHRAELMKKAEPSSLDNYQRGTYTTLDLSYKALPQRSRDFLHFVSFFHHTEIPLSAFVIAAKQNFEDGVRVLPRPDEHGRVCTDLRRLLCVDGSWSEMKVQETLRTLRSFSLVSISSINDSLILQLHPLIRAWSRDMDNSTSQHHRLMALQVLTACCRDDAFLLYRHILPHILDVLNQLKAQDMHVNDLIATGKVVDQQGNCQAAAELFEVALVEMRKATGNHEKFIATASLWLAQSYWRQGRYSEAEVLELRKSVPGMEHWETISAAANLAVTYCAQGRLSDAQGLEEEVFKQLRRILGKKHPDTIMATANLAVTYHAQGRWSEAVKLKEEVLERRRRILGMEHPDTILAVSNLAATYQAQGRWSEAVALMEKVLEQRKRALGMEHPDTVVANANLAATYRTQGRLSDTEGLEVEVLEQRRRILGSEHPDTIRAASNLAVTYSKQGRWEECAATPAPAVQLSLKVLGHQHPDTQMRLRSLMVVYQKLDKEKEAQETRDLLTS